MSIVHEVSEAKAKAADIDELDAGWDGEGDGDDDEDLDAGWDHAEDPEQADGSGEEQDADEPEPRGLTPEERIARAALMLERKERQRAKAATKAERRKARASKGAAKQKKSAPRAAGAKPRRAPVRNEPRRAEASSRVLAEPAQTAALERASAIPMARVTPRTLVIILLIVLGAAGALLVLWKH
jgi:hypothetical protein